MKFNRELNGKEVTYNVCPYYKEAMKGQKEVNLLNEENEEV